MRQILGTSNGADYRFLYLSSTLRSGGFASEPRLRDFADRHLILLPSVSARPIGNPLEEIHKPDVHGVVVSMSRGLPNLDQLRFAEYILAYGFRVWFYWPGEAAIECVDRERIKSYQRHFMAVKVWETVRPLARVAHALARKVARESAGTAADQATNNWNSELAQIIAQAKPVGFEFDFVPSAAAPLPGVGLYLRTDYWAPLTSGGSYGHTCYVALSLARTVEHLVCLTPSHYPLLGELGLDEAVMPAPGVYTGERDLLLANRHYYSVLRSACDILKPAFIYERLCLGNYCGARVSQEFGIPYIVEYNGSEIEMSRTFEKHRFQYEDLFLKAEEAAFCQATIISVVSEALKEDLVSRGFSASKILVNPNGVDPEEYAPPTDAQRLEVRKEIGFNDSDTVVGFIGTFGGWHGIDVLSEALPQICSSNASARFLLVGDGSYKHLVDSAVQQHGLEDRVICVGRVTQQEGARLLRGCDIYVSPHSRVMSSGRFFGSPTKLFEYMAMGRGIVASDLDQIGEILSPALRPAHLNGPQTRVVAERAVLCRPGDVSEFVHAVKYLIRNPEIASALGQNARRAALANHTWDRHVHEMWRFLTATKRTTPGAVVEPIIVDKHRGDVSLHRRELQDALVYARECLTKQEKPHTLEWYLEIEADHRRHTPWVKDLDARQYANKKVLEIGTGVGTDLVQFAKNGAEVTYLNPSAPNLALAQENFALRNLHCYFVHDTGQEQPPFEIGVFDLVYCCDFSYVSNPGGLVSRIRKVLKPSGQVVALALAENSYHHWFIQFLRMGIISGLLDQFSMAEIVSREHAATGEEKRIVRTYTGGRLRQLFAAFRDVRITHPQLLGEHLLLRGAAPRVRSQVL
jgi:glycosyltransferase involved in cell wall biosynthesis/SAM-dependent methyltransferase